MDNGQHVRPILSRDVQKKPETILGPVNQYDRPTKDMVGIISTYKFLNENMYRLKLLYCNFGSGPSRHDGKGEKTLLKSESKFVFLLVHQDVKAIVELAPNRLICLLFVRQCIFNESDVLFSTIDMRSRQHSQ